MKSAQEILGSRRVKAVELRRSGMTYKQVGEALGVGSCRARQIVVNSEWKLRLIDEGKDKELIAALELGVRACNVLRNVGVSADRASVREAIEDGRLNPNPSMTVDYGWKTHSQMCEYAGMGNPNLHRKKMRIDTLRNEIRNIEKEIEHYKEIAAR